MKYIVLKVSEIIDLANFAGFGVVIDHSKPIDLDAEIAIYDRNNKFYEAHRVGELEHGSVRLGHNLDCGGEA